jgi:hydroxypyruvate isomerase
MPKFSLCIEPVLTDYDFYDRIRIAAELGYDAVEFWDPADKDIDRIAQVAAANRIVISVCCVKSAWQLRMNFPRDQVVANVKESIRIAKTLNAPSLIGLSGDNESDPKIHFKTLTDNLKAVAEMLEAADVTLCMESLNSTVDHEGYYLDSSRVGFDLVRAVDSPCVKLLYDVYHMQIMEGNIIETIQKNIDCIGHFHSAGVPGRHEHFNGETDYKNVLKAVDATGYTRYFGLEYWPTYDHRKSLEDCLRHLKQ